MPSAEIAKTTRADEAAAVIRNRKPGHQRAFRGGSCKGDKWSGHFAVPEPISNAGEVIEAALGRIAAPYRRLPQRSPDSVSGVSVAIELSPKQADSDRGQQDMPSTPSFLPSDAAIGPFPNSPVKRSAQAPAAWRRH